MPLAAPALDALRETLPEEFKDTAAQPLERAGRGEPRRRAGLGVALAAARFDRGPRSWPRLSRPTSQAGLGDSAAAVISDAIAAAGLMAMNTVYYRFRHMIGARRATRARPARLRMTPHRPAGHRQGDFELMSLACAALAGCEFCLKNHEAKLVEPRARARMPATTPSGSQPWCEVQSPACAEHRLRQCPLPEGVRPAYAPEGFPPPARESSCPRSSPLRGHPDSGRQPVFARRASAARARHRW